MARQLSWLEHMVHTHGVEGSNPPLAILLKIIGTLVSNVSFFTLQEIATVQCELIKNLLLQILGIGCAGIRFFNLKSICYLVNKRAKLYFEVLLFCVSYSIFSILSIASIVFSLFPKEVNLKYFFPFSPNPAPGVPTT